MVRESAAGKNLRVGLVRWLACNANIIMLLKSFDALRLWLYFLPSFHHLGKAGNEFYIEANCPTDAFRHV